MTEAGWRSDVRVLLVHPDLPAVLMHAGDRGWRLPRVRLPERVSLEDPATLIAAVRAQLDVEVIELFPLGEVPDPESATIEAATIEAAVACELRAGRTGTPGATWIGADQLDKVEAPDRAPLGATLARILAEGSGQQRAPWSERGWFGEAERWLSSAARAAGCEPTGPVQQFRTWGISSVLRVPTTRGMIYLKASADLPLFVNEAVVTQCLGSLFPGFVPVTLAIDTERRWLALADFGQAMEWDTPAAIRIEAFRSFARLQIASAEKVDRLLAAGCLDRRLDWLASEQAIWFASPQARSLLAEEFGKLQACSAALPALCARLAAFGVPDTLQHGDMHPGNVARNEGGFVFFDWTDAAIGHPFLDMIAIAGEEDPQTESAMRTAYLAEWAQVIDPDQAEQAWELAVVLMAANQVITFLSLSANLGQSDPGMKAACLRWLHRLISAAPEQLASSC